MSSMIADKIACVNYGDPISDGRSLVCSVDLWSLPSIFGSFIDAIFTLTMNSKGISLSLSLSLSSHHHSLLDDEKGQREREREECQGG